MKNINLLKHEFYQSYCNSKQSKLYIVTYTIHNDKNNIIRSIVEKVLRNNNYIRLGTTLYMKYTAINYDLYCKLLCNFEKYRLLEQIKKELLNKIHYKYLYNTISEIKL